MTYIRNLICSSFAQTYELQVPMYCPNQLLNVNGAQSNPIHIKGAIENLQVSNMFLASNIIVQTRWTTKIVFILFGRS
jgi:hypothetical protein